MLLGCCHCGEDPSESIPPSESTQSGSGSAPDFTYGECDCAAVPKTWELIWPTMDSNAPCQIAAGTYELIRQGSKTFPGSAFGGCTWESAALAPRMKVISSVWTCEAWPTAPPAFRVFVIPSVFITHLRLLVSYSVWTPSGFGSYIDYNTSYANTLASPPSSPCIHNGVLTTGGSPNTWPNQTDVTFPYTFINLPTPGTITLRPKL